MGFPMLVRWYLYIESAPMSAEAWRHKGAGHRQPWYWLVLSHNSGFTNKMFDTVNKYIVLPSALTYRHFTLCYDYMNSLPLLRAGLSNHTPSNGWDDIIYPVPNFNGTIEEWKWIGDLIPHFMKDVITYPYWDLSLSLKLMSLGHLVYLMVVIIQRDNILKRKTRIAEHIICSKV